MGHLGRPLAQDRRLPEPSGGDDEPREPESQQEPERRPLGGAQKGPKRTGPRPHAEEAKEAAPRQQETGGGRCRARSEGHGGPLAPGEGGRRDPSRTDFSADPPVGAGRLDPVDLRRDGARRPVHGSRDPGV